MLVAYGLRCIIPIAGLLWTTVALAAPTSLAYRGALTQDDGTPFVGDIALKVALFDSEDATVPVWGPVLLSPFPVIDGHFDLVLGSGTQPALTEAMASDCAFIEVTVDDVTLSPRQALTAAPYALRAADADLLAGVPIDSLVMLADLAPYAQVADLGAAALSNSYADLDGTPELTGFALSTGLSDVVRTADLVPYAETADLAPYAKSVDLGPVATSNSYADLDNIPNLSRYAQTANLNSVATTGAYRDLSDVPDLSTFAAQNAVDTLASELDAHRVLGVIDVRSHGAVGDGVADDTAAIQAALTRAGGASTGSSATVYLPTGHYRISATLEVPSGIRLVGDGATSVIERNLSVSPPFDLLELDGVSDVIIEKLKVDGIDRATTEFFIGIRIWSSLADAARGAAQFIHYDDIPADAHLARNIVVRDVTCTRVHVPERSGAGKEGGCIAVTHADGVLLDRIHAYDVSWSGILVATGARNIVVTNSHLHDNRGSGMSSTNFRRYTFSNNIVHDNGATNISVNGREAVVANNLSYRSMYSGIIIGHAHPVSVASGSVCVGNRVFDNGLSGIEVRNSDDVLVANNTVTGNATMNPNGGIRVDFDTAAGAVYSTTGRVVIRGNLVRDNFGPGILVEWGAGNVVADNQVEANTSTGIYVTGEATATTVVGNVVRHAGTKAIDETGATNQAKWWVGGILFLGVDGYVLDNLVERGPTALTSGVLATEGGVAQASGNRFLGFGGPTEMYKTATSGSFTNIAAPVPP